MKKAKIFYFSLTDEQTKDEKLAWFGNTKLKNIDFERIDPDKTNNWVDQADNDFEDFLPCADKNTKLTKSQQEEQAIFKLFSLGVVTNRDEWVYDFSVKNLSEKMKYFFSEYEQQRVKFQQNHISDYESSGHIKWTRELKRQLSKSNQLEFSDSCFIISLYRPYIKKYIYYQKAVNEMQYQISDIFPKSGMDNFAIYCTDAGTQSEFMVIATKYLPDSHLVGTTAQCLPLYRYDKEGNRVKNITDWGLNKFQIHYKNQNITKENIFHYVYAVLHNPAYRQKYEQNLKREFPRIPFYENFFQWTEWGQELMELHINYETIKPYPLKHLDISSDKTPKPKLKADKIANKIILDDITTLENIPKIAWDYKLGNRCALEWILDQYKEKKPKDPTIAEKFNTYKFADYKEQVIELLQRVCTVSVETMQIIQLMEKIDLP